jgi:hypothetical protein
MTNFDPVVLSVFSMLCIFGLVTNSAALVYTLKALRGVQRSLLFLLVTDSITSLTG